MAQKAGVFVFYLRLKPYVEQWLRNDCGLPVRFRRGSGMYKCIQAVVTLCPREVKPDVAAPGLTPVEVVSYSGRDKMYYNYVSDEDKKWLCGRLEAMFTALFIDEVYSYSRGREKECRKRIYSFMKRHGIDFEQMDTLVRKFHRLRAIGFKRHMNERMTDTKFREPKQFEIW